MTARPGVRRLFLMAAAALLAGAASGAVPDTLSAGAAAPESAIARSLPDSSLFLPLLPAERSAAAPAGSKSPGRALLFSALLPGAGQVYNESYWKVPVVAGVGAFFVSRWLHFNRLAGEARDRYAESLLTSSGDQQQLRLREFYKDERDTYSWYLFILYLLNVADAYVDAALYDFSVSDDLSLRVLPEGPARVGLRITF